VGSCCRCNLQSRIPRKFCQHWGLKFPWCRQFLDVKTYHTYAKNFLVGFSISLSPWWNRSNMTWIECLKRKSSNVHPGSKLVVFGFHESRYLKPYEVVYTRQIIKSPWPITRIDDSIEPNYWQREPRRIYGGLMLRSLAEALDGSFTVAYNLHNIFIWMFRFGHILHCKLFIAIVWLWMPAFSGWWVIGDTTRCWPYSSVTK